MFSWSEVALPAVTPQMQAAFRTSRKKTLKKGRKSKKGSANKQKGRGKKACTTKNKGVKKRNILKRARPLQSSEESGEEGTDGKKKTGNRMLALGRHRKWKNIVSRKPQRFVASLPRMIMIPKRGISKTALSLGILGCMKYSQIKFTDALTAGASLMVASPAKNQAFVEKMLNISAKFSRTCKLQKFTCSVNLAMPKNLQRERGRSRKGKAPSKRAPNESLWGELPGT